MTDKQIGETLKDLGILPSYKGYNYIIDLVSMIQSNDLQIGFMSKVGYPKVARKWGCTSESVERSCRNSIFTSYKRYGDVFYDVLRIRQRPSITKFVFTLADYLSVSESKDLYS